MINNINEKNNTHIHQSSIHPFHLSIINKYKIVLLKSEKTKKKLYYFARSRSSQTTFFFVCVANTDIMSIHTCTTRCQIQLYLFIFKKKAAKNVQLQFVHCIVNILYIVQPNTLRIHARYT